MYREPSLGFKKYRVFLCAHVLQTYSNMPPTSPEIVGFSHWEFSQAAVTTGTQASLGTSPPSGARSRRFATVHSVLSKPQGLGRISSRSPEGAAALPQAGFRPRPPCDLLLPPVHSESGKHILTCVPSGLLRRLDLLPFQAYVAIAPSSRPKLGAFPQAANAHPRYPSVRSIPQTFHGLFRNTMAGPHSTLTGFLSQSLCWEADDRVLTPGPEPAPTPRLPPFLRGQGSHTTDARTPGSQLPLLIFKLGN